MTTPKRNPEVVDAISLNKFLMGLHNQLITKEVSVEEAEVHSKVADKIVKLNLVRLMYDKQKNRNAPIDFFETEESKLLFEKKENIKK